jgi:hypothetical protein
LACWAGRVGCCPLWDGGDIICEIDEKSTGQNTGGKMKPKLIIVFLLCCFLTSYARAQEFGYPCDGESWYFIKIIHTKTSSTHNQNWKINKVIINGDNVRDFVAYQNGTEALEATINGNFPFELKTRYSWTGKKEYKFQIELLNTETEKPLSVEMNVKSPPMKGYWNPEWKNYLTLNVAEESGYRRTHYPIHATVGILSKYVRSKDEIRVVRAEKKGVEVAYTEIPVQVYNVTHWDDQELLQTEEIEEESGTPISRYHPTTTFSLCFLTDLGPNEKASYLVFYNNPSAEKPVYETDLVVSGDGLGKSIENEFYRVLLDEKSGMITEIVEKQTDTKLEHKLETNGAIHWNPGTYSPPHSWSHCSDWENPPFSEVTGPIFYSLHRAAPLPHLKDVMVSIDYYFYKDSPVILMESTMQITEDIFVKALRNGEVVFNKEVFSNAAYQSLRGKVHDIDFSKTRMHPEHVITLRADTPWITFFNEEKNTAFASLFLDVSASNLMGGGASLQQPYIYIQHGPWYYLSRAFVYSFGSNNQSRMLPVKNGSIYHERIGWIPFSFKKKKEMRNTVRKFYNMFKNPLHLTEVIETFPESPEGWLVPILTEPFEEGVQDALKGKKKK